MCSLHDPSKVLLIDFGISVPVKTGIPRREDPIESEQTIMDTVPWVSLNGHRGIGTPLSLPPRQSQLHLNTYTIYRSVRSR